MIYPLARVGLHPLQMDTQRHCRSAISELLPELIVCGRSSSVCTLR